LNQLIKKLVERIDQGTVECDTLEEGDIWARHGPVVWKANEFKGTPHFYPVYKFGDFYSHSVLSLILKKGSLNLNGPALKQVQQSGFFYWSGSETIDMDIRRLGRAHTTSFKIQNVQEFAERIAAALIDDIHVIESKNPGYTNVVMCGGKDSLNLLLLPWKQNTIAASAEPNFELVKQFIEDNNLPYKVLRIEDPHDQRVLDHEVLEGCCRADLAHWRWGAHLKKIADEYDKKLIFWKGQVADLYTSDKWKVYMHPVRKPEEFARKVYKRLEKPLPFVINQFIGRRLQPSIIQATWDRSASQQGCHVGFIREITDCLTVSAYHGPAMIKVWSEVDLGAVAQRDMRHLVGRILLGRDVVYPKINPSPGLSKIRQGVYQPQRFLDALKEGGIKVNSDCD